MKNDFELYWSNLQQVVCEISLKCNTWMVSLETWQHLVTNFEDWSHFFECVKKETIVLFFLKFFVCFVMKGKFFLSGCYSEINPYPSEFLN